jgi:uncharacterized protein (DUF58 family)
MSRTIGLAPSRRLLFVVGALTVAALAPAFVGAAAARVYLAALSAAAALAAFDAVRCLPARDVVASLFGPADLCVGEEFALDVRASLRDGAPGADCEARLETDPRVEEPPPAAFALAAGGTARVAFPTRAVRRGPAAPLRLWLRWASPWRLWTRTAVVAEAALPAVGQDVRPVRETARRATAAVGARPGLRTRLTPGEGSDFDALREFSRGHDRRALHWKASARHRKLLVRDFRAEGARHVVLAFDTGRLMSEPMDGVERFDHAARAGLLLAYDATRAGDLVGAYSFGAAPGPFVAPAAGAAAFRAVRAATASLVPSPEESNFATGLSALASRLKRRTLIAVFTDFSDATTAEHMTELLGALAKRHVVLFVALRDAALDATADAAPVSARAAAAAATAYEFVRERAQVLARLRRLGVDVLDATPGEAAPGLVERYLRLKRRERL